MSESVDDYSWHSDPHFGQDEEEEAEDESYVLNAIVAQGLNETSMCCTH
jgi:hypothetical protein